MLVDEDAIEEVAAAANILAAQAKFEEGDHLTLTQDNGQSYAVLFFDAGYSGKELQDAIRRRRYD